MVKIAIIEDEPSIRGMYELKLKKTGYSVRGAEDGRLGLELIEDFKPDLVLLDLRMPIMDGATMLKELRKHDWAKHILVIVLTNLSKEEAPMELRLLDVKQYLIKAHYTPSQVVEIVTETLKRYNKVPATSP